MDQAAIEFDLIYTPRAMELLLLDSVGEDLLHALLLKGRTDDVDDCIYEALLHYEKGCNIIYYHCGGVEGNPTQLNRYSVVPYEQHTTVPNHHEQHTIVLYHHAMT